MWWSGLSSHLDPPPERNELAAKKKASKRTKAAKPRTKRRQSKSLTHIQTVDHGIRRRGAVNKAINQAIMRERIAARGHDTRANEVLKELRKIGEEVRALKYMDKEAQAKYMTRIGALKTELDGHFKFLNKYLPDQRSVELKDPDGNNPFERAAVAWASVVKGGLTVTSTEDDE